MNVVITGASQGLGLALVETYLDTYKDRVWALTRRSSDELEYLKTQYREDLTIVEEWDTVGNISFLPPHVNLLINNAAVFDDVDVGAATEFDVWVDLAESFYVNSYLPLWLTAALRDRLANGGRVINISSIMGTRAGHNPAYGYRMSKAALNVATEQLAKDLKGDGISVFAIHPGHVRTDMGGDDAELDPLFAAARIAKFADRAKSNYSGKFYNLDSLFKYDGLK